MTRQFKRLTHSLYECKYHIVFCTKYRHQILRDEVAEYARQQIYRLCQQKDEVEVLELSIPFVCASDRSIPEKAHEIDLRLRFFE